MLSISASDNTTKVPANDVTKLKYQLPHPELHAAGDQDVWKV